MIYYMDFSENFTKADGIFNDIYRDRSTMGNPSPSIVKTNPYLLHIKTNFYRKQ
jgi:hypothetical protein